MHTNMYITDMHILKIRPANRATQEKNKLKSNRDRLVCILAGRFKTRVFVESLETMAMATTRTTRS